MNDPFRAGFGRRSVFAPLLILVFVGSGCTRPERDQLVIATPWPASERVAIETAYRAHVPGAAPIAWVALFPGDDPTRLVPQLGIDLVLGLHETDLDRLANSGRLEIGGLESLRFINGHYPRDWVVVRRSTMGLAVNTSCGVDVAGPGLDARSLDGWVALDDPRRDPVSLGWAKARIKAKGYGEVVRSAANVLRIGRGGSSLASVVRGETAVTPAVGTEGAIDDRSTLVKLEGAPGWIEGAAIVQNARRLNEAQAFLLFLHERGQATPTDTEVDPQETLHLEADRLLADLLGASLVDAHDELRAASAALDHAGSPAELRAYLEDAPPWPPTSVAKLQSNVDGQAMVATLAREISDDPDVRFWLLSTWDRPSIKIDDAWFREASGAAEGRVVQEPRFRAWLRGEWTAWARQHYRRIAREAGKVAR